MPISETQVEAEIERLSGRHVNETRLRLALGAAHMGTWERNLLTGEDLWSAQQQELFGLSPGAFSDTHQDFLRLIHPDDRKGIEESVRRALEGHETYHSEYRLVMPDGSIRWMAGTGDVIRDSTGKPTHIVGVTMDITARKVAEQRIAAQEQRFRALIEKSWDAVAILSRDGSVQYITPSVTRLLGYTPEEFAASDVFGLVHPDDKQATTALFDRMLASPGGSVMAEYRFLHKDGSWRWMEAAGTNLLADPAVVGIVANFRDISERKRVEEERSRLLAAEQAARKAAEDADRTKDAFLATVSHELRTPLTAIFGWAQLLQTAQCNPEEILRGLKTIERNAKSMTRLVEDVLDVSRIITGKLFLRSEPVDLAAVIDAAIDAVRPSAQARQIGIIKRLDPQLGTICGDPGRLQQVVWNLLVNSVKFTPQGGQVSIELTQDGPHMQITVADNGEGISPNFLPLLFKRFTQANGSSRRPHAGLGLGLAIVYQLVELHGGTVQAQSTGPGQGATFTVRLPLAAAVSAAPAQCPVSGDTPATRPAQDLKGIEVLLVDDDPESHEFVRRLLLGCGAHVRSAFSTPEALSLLERSTPAVLLSAIGMPGRDGYDLIRTVRETERSNNGAPLPAAAVTAFAHPEDRARALAAGFQVHVSKPFEPAELVAIVAELARAAS